MAVGSLSSLAPVALGLLILSPSASAFSPSAPHLLSPSAPHHRFLNPLTLRPSSPRASRPLSSSAPQLLKAQLKPGNSEDSEASKIPEPPSEYAQFYSEFRKSSASEAANLPSLFLLPLGAAIVMGGLLMPSPEMLEGLANTMTEPIQVVSAAATGAVSQGQQGGLSVEQLSNPSLDPSKFVPVCQFSDGFYRTGQALIYKIAGPQTYQEYAPLIAGSLLRVRLEFCVLESFVYESIIPFIKARGLSWVFPLQETLETFIAGVVFAVATNLVLIGSTKIITIIVSYFDFFVGLPLRLIFGFINDRMKDSSLSKNPLGGFVVLGTGAGKAVGQVSGVTRRVVEAADVFVGRYLLLTTVGYVILKFLKFKGLLVFDIGGFFNGVKTVAEALGSLAN